MPRTRPTQFDNAITPPIWTSAAFYFENSEAAQRYRDGGVNRGRYGRYDNPSWLETEQSLAQLEGCSAALLFPSGMSAVATLTLALARTGDAIIYTRCGYRNIATFFEDYATAGAISVHSVNQADDQQFKTEFARAYTDRCRIVFIEMPSNPHLFLVDLEWIVSRIDGRRTTLVVDSTFATPANFHPTDHGANLVVHSCTKYLSGDGDLLAGCVVGNDEQLIERIRAARNVSGAIASGFTASLLQRSLQTFDLRMERINREGMRLAFHLQNHPLVRRVFYTGLPSHPQAALAQRYLRGHGGVVSFELDLDTCETARVVDAMRLPFMGTNFGCHHAMIEQCAPFTFSKLTPAERGEIGISDSLIRLSIGRYSADELMDDFDQATRPAMALARPVG